MKKNIPWIVNRIFILIYLILPCILNAASYYVDQKHPAASDRNPGTLELPWKTINKANQVLLPGDIVFIKAGNYTSFISPVNSGTPEASVTYRNFNNDKVIISDTTYAILLDRKSYITISGINFYNLDRFMFLQNGSNYNTIAYCNFDQARMTNGKTASWAGSVINRNSRYNHIHHCRFSKYGYFTDDDISCILDIGSENNKNDLTGHNLVEDCIFFHSGHHVLGVYGMNNVIRNNYIHNEAWSMGTSESDRGAVLYGDRNVNVSGHIENSGRHLFEGNQIAYSADPSDNKGSSGMSMNASYNIVRFNRYYYNDLRGLSMSLTRSYLQDIIHNKIYHNTFFQNTLNTEGLPNCGILFAYWGGTHVIKHNALKNNLIFSHQKAFDFIEVSPDSQIFAGNWDGDTQGDPKFVNASLTPGDPMDQSLPDLHLMSDSPCKDKGTYLTTITSRKGSGNSFKVEDAGYFMDGWWIPGVKGDEVQLFGTSQRARITHVDYSRNLITLDRKVRWKHGQGVCLSYTGNAPDPGAFE